MDRPELYGTATLAFVGDAVYSLLVRQKLAAMDLRAGALHARAVAFVNAAAQNEAYQRIAPLLSEKETSLYLRGRNLHTNHAPKNASTADYHAATGLEVLFGYLHLTGQTQRTQQLFEVIWNAFSGQAKA